MKKKSPGTKAVAPASVRSTKAAAKNPAQQTKPAKAAPAKAARAKTTAKAKTKPAKPAAKVPKAPAAKKPAKVAPASKKKATSTAADPLARGKALEAVDAAEPKQAPAAKAKATATVAAAGAAAPIRNSDFPRTYIKSINVSLNDPDHRMTLVWTGPKATSQETGPFRTSPGAGLKGLNCDNTTTSRTSGSLCTPKGTHKVQGFQSALNSDARATNVTWFVRARGIALHYFPSVPKYAASHGCVRIEQKRVAQLIQQNARVDLTTVVIDGTWTKPVKQW